MNVYTIYIKYVMKFYPSTPKMEVVGSSGMLVDLYIC
jgi:hypothetical protein